MSPYNADATATQLVNDYASLIRDKVVLTTGVSPNSLGGFFVQTIAKAKPSYLIFAARNLSKAQQTAQEIIAAEPEVKIRTLQLDLGSFKSVREAADQAKAWDDILSMCWLTMLVSWLRTTRLQRMVLNLNWQLTISVRFCSPI